MDLTPEESRERLTVLEKIKDFARNSENMVEDMAVVVEALVREFGLEAVEKASEAAFAKLAAELAAEEGRAPVVGGPGEVA